MGILRRIWGRQRRKERVRIRLPVLVETREGQVLKMWTLDLSESGLRMDITDSASLSDLTWGNRDVEVGIVVDEAQDPIQVLAEPIWTTRNEDGTLASGWMFGRFRGEGQGRLASFLRSYQSKHPAV